MRAPARPLHQNHFGAYRQQFRGRSFHAIGERNNYLVHIGNRVARPFSSDGAATIKRGIPLGA